MKRIIEEQPGNVLENLLGETVVFLCLNYFYTGKLVGVNDNCVELADAKIIYETGEWSESKWKDAQAIGISPFYLQLDTIESFGVTNK